MLSGRPCGRPGRDRRATWTSGALRAGPNPPTPGRRANIRSVSASAHSRPVGVFDSGVGGLTVLHECLVSLPHEDFVYLGDTARFPYGERSADELRAFARELAGL